MNIRNLPEKEKPREKLMMLGAASLSDAELLAILLGTGTKELPVMELAEKLLAYRDLEDKQPLKESVVESVQHSGAKTLGENLEKIYVKALRS